MTENGNNMYRLLGLIGCVGLVVVMAACGEDPFETPTNPNPPVPVTETFTGTVNQNGAQTHTFSSSASGTVTATLTTLGPDSALIIGLALGTWNGNVCQIVLPKDNATQGSVITGGVSALGNLCVRIYDVGNVTAAEPATYEITVVHP